MREFLPGTYSGCDGAANWRNGTDGRNFFVVANGTDAFGSDSPDNICHNMVEIWVMAIVVMCVIPCLEHKPQVLADDCRIFYLLCGIINVLIGFGGAIMDGSGSKTSWGSPPQYDLELFVGLLVPLMLLATPFVYVYRYICGFCYICFRYVVKYLSRNKVLQLLDTKQLPPTTKKSSLDRPDAPTKPNSPRLPMELVIMIARDLHYADLLDLAQSSKALRAVFFGDRSPTQVARDLRPFVCDRGSTTASCLVCRVQICPVRHPPPVHYPSSHFGPPSC